MSTPRIGFAAGHRQFIALRRKLQGIWLRIVRVDRRDSPCVLPYL